MASERTTQIDTANHATTTPDREAPWSNLEVAVPNDRDHASLVALVECALIELTHEYVGAVVVAHQMWGTKRTQYIAVDDVGEQFQKRHFDSRLGWHEITVPREIVRDELITQLTRSAAPPAERTREAAASEPNNRGASSGTPDSITDTLNQHSGPVLAQCWLTTFQNSCLQLPSTVLFLHDVAVIDYHDPRPD